MREVKVILKKDRQKPVKARHPWIFSGAIDLIDEDFEPGSVVCVYSSDGEFLGKGYLNPRSEIAIRMLVYHDEEINKEFFKARIATALELRRALMDSSTVGGAPGLPGALSRSTRPGFRPRASGRAQRGPLTNACRIINSEGDYLPGLIADRYGPYLVVQVLTLGMEKFQDLWVGALAESLPVRGIYGKADPEARYHEGLKERLETLWGEEPPDFVEIQENGMKFLVDIKGGQKTGFYLDQRENRSHLRQLSGGKKILNAFSYTGGFSVACALGGASSVTSVETSERALNTCLHNFEANGLDPKQHVFLKEDVFNCLRKMTEDFDVVILDPPAFAKSRNQVMEASRGYKDINLLAMRRLKRGGLLFTSSCSSFVPPDLFQKIVFSAAKDAKCHVQILAKTGHPIDHPVSIYHPEGEYLKGLRCRILAL